MRALPEAEPLEGRLLMAVLDILEPQAGAISAQADFLDTRGDIVQQDHKTAVLGTGATDYTNPPLVIVSDPYAPPTNFLGDTFQSRAQATLQSTNSGNSWSITLATSADSLEPVGWPAEAAIGTNQFGNPDDSGIAVTVQIEPSPGEQVGQPVRIDLSGTATGTIYNDHSHLGPAGSSWIDDNVTSYQISYQTQSGLTDVIKGSWDTDQPRSKSDSNSDSFQATIGDSFNLVLRLSSSVATTWTIGEHADGTLQLNMSATALPGGTTVPVQPAATPPTLVRARATRVSGNQQVLVLTFSEALDPARAQNPANYTVEEITTQGKGKHAREKLKPVRVVSATYDPQAHTVTLRLAGKQSFKQGAQITVHAGAPGAADGIADEQGVHLAGDGVHEGTDATVRIY
jgi:hypothetical protein